MSAKVPKENTFSFIFASISVLSNQNVLKASLYSSFVCSFLSSLRHERYKIKSSFVRSCSDESASKKKVELLMVQALRLKSSLNEAS